MILCLHSRTFDIVAREKSCNTLHDSFPPPVIILLEDVDGLTLLEGKFILLVGVVVIDGQHLLQIVPGHPGRDSWVVAGAAALPGVAWAWLRLWCRGRGLARGRTLAQRPDREKDYNKYQTILSTNSPLVMLLSRNLRARTVQILRIGDCAD